MSCAAWASEERGRVWAHSSISTPQTDVKPGELSSIPRRLVRRNSNAHRRLRSTAVTITITRPTASCCHGRVGTAEPTPTDPGPTYLCAGSHVVIRQSATEHIPPAAIPEWCHRSFLKTVDLNFAGIAECGQYLHALAAAPLVPRPPDSKRVFPMTC